MSSIPVESTPAETKLAQAFSRMGEGARPSDFARRETAFRAFQTLGIPGSKVEEFKYTDLRERIGDIPPPAGPSDDKRNASILSRESAFEDIPAYRFSFVDGRLARREPVGNGDSTPFVETESWSGALSRGDADISLLDGVKGLKDNALYQLNSALRTPDDPALNLNIVRVRAGARLEKPLHFRFCTGEAAVTAATRVAVVVEDGASATILESHEGAGDAAHFLDDVFLLRLGRGARVTHVR
ncbi:MAG: hypothetical protein LBR29_03175, partial [Methylobacteriaceae bacterium]|nr:hypothetical protein [Methylobacteriaceae bacterium]